MSWTGSSSDFFNFSWLSALTCLGLVLGSGPYYLPGSPARKGVGGHPLILTSSWSRRVKRVGGLLHLTFGGVLRDCDSQYLAVFGWLSGSRLGSRFILFPVPLQLEEPFLKFLP